MNKLGCAAVALVGAAGVVCCGGGALLANRDSDPEIVKPSNGSGLSIDISTPKGKEAAAQYVRECTIHEKDEIHRALTSAGLAEDDLAIKCTPPVNYARNQVMGYVDLNVDKEGNATGEKHAVLAPEFFLEGQTACHQAAALAALERCTSADACDVYRDMKEPTLTEGIRKNAKDVWTECEAQQDSSEAPSPTDVEPSPDGPDAPSTPAAPETESKLVNKDTLWSATQKGYLENEEGRMEGTFKGANTDTGILIGTWEKAGTKLEGQFEYTQKPGKYFGFGAADFQIVPYGATTLTWADDRKLILNFSESTPGEVDYSKPAQYTNSEKETIPLDSYSAGTPPAWYTIKPGEASDQTCTPRAVQYMLYTHTDEAPFLAINNIPLSTARTDCTPPAAN